MDCIDRVVYDFPEELDWMDEENIRKAFIKMFEHQNNDALIVMKYLVGVTHYEHNIISNDGNLNSQELALHGVMRGIKDQLNKKPIRDGERPKVVEGYTDE